MTYLIAFLVLVGALIFVHEAGATENNQSRGGSIHQGILR